MRVALAQINSTADPAQNLGIIRSWVQRAAHDGAELVVFPEATMRRFGYPLRQVAEPIDGPWAGQVRDIAMTFGCTVVVGMFTPADERRVYNTVLVTGPDGHTGYDKVHLFDAFGFRESDTVAPGTQPGLVTVAGTTVGLATCYDVRFPGLFTHLARAGANLILVCASWGAGPGKVDQWQLLTRARALDSTTFVAACGQADPGSASSSPDDGRPTDTAPTGVGYSAVMSPWGSVLAALGPHPDLLLADLDFAEVSSARTAVGVLDNARW